MNIKAKKSIYLCFFAILASLMFSFVNKVPVYADEINWYSSNELDNPLEEQAIIQNYLSNTKNAEGNAVSAVPQKKIIDNIVLFIKFKGQGDVYADRGGYNYIIDQINGINKYVKEVSENQLEVNNIFYQLEGGTINCYEDIQPKEYYMKYSDTNPLGYKETGMFRGSERRRELLDRVKDYVGNDFIKYLKDENRDYKFTFIVPECENWQDLLWSHQSTTEVLGKTIDYTFVTVDNKEDKTRTFCHEFLHSIGFPDMYRYNYSATTLGDWSIMEYGFGYPTVHERLKYGQWIQNDNAIKEITKDGFYELSPVSSGQGNTIAYKIPIPGHRNEYFMLEYRGSNVGNYEKNIQDGNGDRAEGIIVYRVNSSENGNAYGPEDEVFVLSNEGQSIYDAYLDGTDSRNCFSNFKLYNSSEDLGISITNVQKINGKMYFNISMKANDKVVSPTGLSINQKDNNNIDLSWNDSKYLCDYYEIFRNDKLIAITKDNKYTDTFNANIGSVYKYEIKSYSSSLGESDTTSGSVGTVYIGDKITIDSIDINNDYGKVGENTRIKINARGGRGELQYKVYYWMPWGDKVIQDYSPNSEINWVPDGIMSWPMEISVKDKFGNVSEVVTKRYHVYSNLQVKSFTADKEAPIKIGDRIKLSADLGNTGSSIGSSNNENDLYEFYYKLNGNTVTIQKAGLETQAYFTPEKPGNYILGVKVVDKITNETAIKEMEYKVKGESQTTIYYKGYDNPYIHYKVGNGSWTKAPGIKMEKSDDVLGYPYKITIDLGNADNLTACFNNGKGSWDSNGQKNYTFEGGYYTYCNGVITMIDKPQKKIKIESLTSKLGNSFVSGNQNIITAKVSNANGEVQYKFDYVNRTTGHCGNLRPYHTSSTYAGYFGEVGNYTVTVTAKDAAGNIATKSIDFTVEEYKSLEIKSVVSSLGDKIKVGQETEFTINTTGGKGTNYYSLYVDGKYILNESSSNKVTWKPEKAGTYEIVAYAREAQGGNVSYKKTITVEEKSKNTVTIYYKGYENPYIHYKVGNGTWTNAPGLKMTPCTEVSGYNYRAEIELGNETFLTACFNNGNGQWDSNGGKNYTFNAGKYGYSNGVIVPINTDIMILDFYCYSDKYNFVDGTVEFRMAATSKNGNVYYTVTAAKGGKTEKLISNSSEGKCLFVPKEAGKYVLTLEVKDDKGNTATKTMDFTVPGNEENVITIYYKGYSNPYMHYKIGNGAWTNAPGVKMEATNEMAGYTHKITVDLKDADNLTACFNNGNGQWDSKNGANYYFSEAGTYTYCNGLINKIK